MRGQQDTPPATDHQPLSCISVDYSSYKNTQARQPCSKSRIALQGIFCWAIITTGVSVRGSVWRQVIQGWQLYQSTTGKGVIIPNRGLGIVKGIWGYTGVRIRGGYTGWRIASSIVNTSRVNVQGSGQ